MRSETKEINYRFPHVGMRIIKSCVAVFLCYIVFLLRGRQGIVFYSQVAVLCCIQPYVDASLKSGLQRAVGTFVGAFFGLAVFLFNYYVMPEIVGSNQLSAELLQYGLIALMLIPVIKTTLLLHQKDAVNLSCVVFLSIVVNHIDEMPFIFVWNRICDTTIGIIIGILVNSFHLPHRKRRDWLFVSGLDDTLLTSRKKMPSYSRIELNQMLENGLNFTISTIRTPASIIPVMEGISLPLPVIAMDGAVLYDIHENKYLRSYVISYSKTKELMQYFRQFNIHCFVNVIREDLLVTYHQELQNEAEKDIYSRLYSSPYRNYLYAELPESSNCIYLMAIDKTEKIQNLYRTLEKDGYTEQLKIVCYSSADYSGYSYLKIYNKNAEKENMIKYLQATLHCTRTITFGSVEGKYDYIISPDRPDQVVRHIKKLFLPIGIGRGKQ